VYVPRSVSRIGHGVAEFLWALVQLREDMVKKIGYGENVPGTLVFGSPERFRIRVSALTVV
jgi:hypothetical protein